MGPLPNCTAPADEPTRREMKRQLDLSASPLAIFVGSAYAPNVQAAEFICKTLAPALPDVAFAICGGVGVELDTETYAALPNVRVTGYLDNAEVHKYLAAADVALNPMFSGSGTNIKMFDFMAAGLPIISTPIGARGISDGRQGSHSRRVKPLILSRQFVGLPASLNMRTTMGSAARRAGGEKLFVGAYLGTVGNQFASGTHKTRHTAPACQCDCRHL